MTAAIIPAVIPPRPGLVAGPAGRPRGRPLPLAAPPPAMPQPAGVVYGAGRIDASGRVADRAVTGALGWSCGDRLTITASEGIVIARRDPGGMVVLPARACLAIPSALRRSCGLRPGDMAVLAAFPGQDAIAAYPVAVVDRHTTLTWVERNFGYAIARAYAGHTDSGGDAGATSTYVRATPSGVAAALTALTGEPHPLATTEGW